MVTANDATVGERCGREVRLSNPGKVSFPASGVGKRRLADYRVECRLAPCTPAEPTPPSPAQ